MTPEAFKEGVGILSTTFPNLDIQGGRTLLVWQKLLDDIPDKAFLSAVLRLCREETQIYPGSNVVAMIRERAVGARAGIVALHLLEEAMRRYGAYVSVVLPDPVIHLVVARMGGWPKLCSMDLDEWKFLRRDFEKLYDAAVKEPIPADQLPARLPGLLEIGNAAAGHHDHPVRIIDLGERKSLPGESSAAIAGGAM
jgi:hypothetical protein